MEQTGDLHVGIVARTQQGTSELKISCSGEEKQVVLNNSAFDTIPAGIFSVSEPGYHWVEFEGIQKSGQTFADIEAVLIGGEATSGEVYFVKDDFYWGRRGPSVHLGFQVPENAGDVKWFYSKFFVFGEFYHPHRRPVAHGMVFKPVGCLQC